ncbi:MAG: hypothetical protein JNJ69_08220 [Leptospiraceae bacterium]|nr:hypothetical protein [Leptospiraceae bacterium]
MKISFAGSLFFLISLFAADLSAHGTGTRKFTGLGLTAGFEYGSLGNPAPAIALTQGYTGIVSYYGSVEAGYRTKDAAFMARATLEAYVIYFGIYAGMQSNTGNERASVYGFPVGIAFLFPVNDPWLVKLHAGAAFYTKEQANEFQIALSVFYRIW